MGKAFILQEIRRTAEANGGRPLGRRRFESETGIRETDWCGVFWIRWSDALREAGYAPLAMQKGYEKEHLFDNYARLALRLRRLPVRADLRLEGRNDSGFPNDKTFSRIGRKAQFLAGLLAYCRDRPEYGDIVQMCQEYLAEHQIAHQHPVPQSAKVGFVYLLKSGRYYKIGKTNAAGRREYEIGMQLPEDPRTIHVIRTDDPGGIEAYWHKRFQAKRKKGEWFDLDASDVSAFKRRKFM